MTAWHHSTSGVPASALATSDRRGCPPLGDNGANNRDCAAVPVVLIVEDDRVLRDVIATCLRDHGWTVLEAGSGEDAVAHAGNEPIIDVVFTDIRLAGTMTGWDVSEHLRHQHARVGVIYTSGSSLASRRRVADSLLFEKPYRPHDIVQACHRLTRR